MHIQTVREVLKSLAAALFFCIAMLVLNPRHVATSSSWDRIVLQMLTFMSGVGLCLVLGALVNTLWNHRALREELHDEAPREAGL